MSRIKAYNKLVRVFGEETTIHAEIFQWSKKFKNGQESVENEPQSERPNEV